MVLYKMCGSHKTPNQNQKQKNVKKAKCEKELWSGGVQV